MATSKEILRAQETKAKSSVSTQSNSNQRYKVGVGSGVVRPVNGFVTFLREQAVVGLAIGLVIGTQAKQIVDSLTANFINPIVGLLTPGGGDLAKKTFTVHYNGKMGVFGWGAFTATLISFIIVVAVIYFAIKGLRLDKLDKKKEK